MYLQSLHYSDKYSQIFTALSWFICEIEYILDNVMNSKHYIPYLKNIKKW